MSRCLRYRNPVICDYLASQYVAGSISSRVRSRIDTLVETTPELDRAIAFYADQFSEVSYRLSESADHADSLGDIWQKVDRDIASLTQAESKITSSLNHKPQKIGFWDTLRAWQITSGIGALASVVLAVMLWVSSPPITDITPSIAGPSYLASMSAHGVNDSPAQFVISAYKKNENAPSRLHVQWSQDHVKTLSKPLHLWAEDKISGQLTYIGIEPNNQSWDLDKSSWQAIASSRRLLMTTNDQLPVDDNIVFSGFCLQLQQWQS